FTSNTVLNNAASTGRLKKTNTQYLKSRLISLLFLKICEQVTKLYIWSSYPDLNWRPLPYQGSALPLSYKSIISTSIWSGRRGSNSRHAAWKAAALPTELLPHDVGTIHFLKS